MGKKYWIHIGIHKTGTTFLQRFFYNHREWLLSHGFLFPSTGLKIPDQPTNPDAMSGHARLFGIFKNAQSQNSQKVLHQFEKEVEETGAENILISSETFSALDRRDICAKNARAVFKDADSIKMICYLRRQDKWLESFYLEVLGWRGRRETRTIRDFFKEEGKKWLDYERLLALWESELGRQSMIVRSYDDAVVGKRLLTDFLSILSIKGNPPESEISNRQINPSLKPSLSEFVRAVNMFPQISNRGKSKILLSMLKTKTNSKKGSLLNGLLWKNIASIYTNININISSKFISGNTENFLYPSSNNDIERVVPWISFDNAQQLICGLTNLPSPKENSDRTIKLTNFGIISTINQGEKQTYEFINYHLNVGASHMVVFFDNPEDQAIEKYIDDHRVTCIRCTDEHWNRLLGKQPKKMADKLRSNPKIGIQILRKKGIQWGIVIDGDELIYSSGNIIKKLSTVKDKFDIVKIKPLEAVQSNGMKDNCVFASTYFKKLTDKKEKFRNKLFRFILISRNLSYTRDGFFGHVEGKTFFRTNAEIDVFRSHSPKSTTKKLSQKWSTDVFLLHYDCMSYENWKHKWWRRIFGTTRAVNIGEKRKLQERLIKDAINGGDKKSFKLFRRLHWWTDRKIAIGKKIGMIVSVNIKDESFFYKKSNFEKAYPTISEIGYKKYKSGSFGIITTIKQNLEQTCEYINYHLNIGVDHMVVFFDDPDDPAISIYSTNERVTAVICTNQYWVDLLGRLPKNMPEKQRVNMEYGSHLIREKRIQWCISIDGDELIHANLDIQKYLCSIDTNVALVKVKPVEAIQHNGMVKNRIFRSLYFKVFLNKEIQSDIQKKIIPELKKNFYYLTKNGFYGHTEGKCFYRSDALIDTYRQHMPKAFDFDLPKIVSKEIHILHFDCMSFENWKAKWYRRIFGNTKAIGISKRRKEQEKLIMDAFNSKDRSVLYNLYESMFWYSNGELRKGKEAGYLIKTNLPDYLFE